MRELNTESGPTDSPRRRLLNFFALFFLISAAEVTSAAIALQILANQNDESFAQALNERVLTTPPRYDINPHLLVSILIPIAFAVFGGLTGRPFKGDEPRRLLAYLLLSLSRRRATHEHSSSRALLFPSAEGPEATLHRGPDGKSIATSELDAVPAARG